MIRFVNAKINLGLNIVRKREDGYHDLESAFYPVGIYNGTPLNPSPFCDILEIGFSQSGQDTFHFTGNHIDCPLENNLVYKAVKSFKDFTGFQDSVSVWLDKHLPDGAGLGGGSADASFTLLTLNELAGAPLSREVLISLAKSLGADCPFFILNRPVIAKGIGELLQPIPLDLSGYWALIVKPDVYVSTKEAFSGIRPAASPVSIETILEFPIEEWAHRGLKNDFEPHIFALYPELEEIKQKILLEGASYAAMSGSGSSIYGIFKNKDSAARATESLKRNYKVYLCKL